MKAAHVTWYDHEAGLVRAKLPTVSGDVAEVAMPPAMARAFALHLMAQVERRQ